MSALATVSSSSSPTLFDMSEYRALIKKAEDTLRGVNPLTPAQIKDLHTETLWQF